MGGVGGGGLGLTFGDPLVAGPGPHISHPSSLLIKNFKVPNGVAPKMCISYKDLCKRSPNESPNASTISFLYKGLYFSL